MVAVIKLQLSTYPFDTTTTPAITVPAGFTSDADAAVLRAAANYERARPWADTKPVLITAP